MRKRSEAVESSQQQAPAVDSRQQTIPGVTSTPPPGQSVAIPTDVTLDNGIVFIKCPDCGLIQSSDTAKYLQVKSIKTGKDTMLLHCLRCKGVVDPDELLTPAMLEILKQKAKDGKVSSLPVTKPHVAVPEPSRQATIPAQPYSWGPDERIIEAERMATKREHAIPHRDPEPTVAMDTRDVFNPNTGKIDKVVMVTEVCKVCGKPFTHTNQGWFSSCGHSQANVQPNVSKVESVEIGITTQETITVTFGEEMFRTGEYQSFRVGPFTRTSTVQRGETGTQAIARVYNELCAFAVTEFHRKAVAHLNALDALVGLMKERSDVRRAQA